MALSAIAAFRSPDALRALVESASDPDAGVSTVAISLLSAVPGTAATMELANLLARSPAREQIVGALSRYTSRGECRASRPRWRRPTTRRPGR